MNSVYQDIPRLYTAIAEWLSCLVYCLALRRKVSNRLFSLIAGAFLILQSLFLVLTKSLPIIFWIPCMLFAVLLMYLFMFFSCDGSKTFVGYYCARAFLLAELSASLEWQLSSFADSVRSSLFIRGLILVLVYGLVFIWAFFMEKSIMRRGICPEINRQELIAAIAIAVAIFAFSNLSFIISDTPFSAALLQDVFYIRTLVDIAGIMILYVYQSRICELQAEKELSSINSMLKAQYEKYRNYQASFDLINMKYHDLKHQLAGLKADMTDGERQKWIDDLEKELDVYSPELQTGNSVLDTLLAGKMMNCKAHNIKVTCVADGTLLEFMHVADICTIFGNALDNAIENVTLIEDEEKRLIHISVSGKKNFVLIQINNYCESRLSLKDGYPVTTKVDKDNHGFGLKSIRYTVEKYKGTVNFSVNKNWFELKILIPQGGA